MKHNNLTYAYKIKYGPRVVLYKSEEGFFLKLIGLEY